jgi:pimeloyl-ACP methyl ester carboxylesterase
MGVWFLDSNRASKVNGSRVNCRVLALAGAEDKIVPPSVVRRIARKYKSVSTYKEFANNAHMVIAEPGWQDIAKYVAEWIEVGLSDS